MELSLKVTREVMHWEFYIITICRQEISEMGAWGCLLNTYQCTCVLHLWAVLSGLIDLICVELIDCLITFY